ncbi:hypothetical protein J5N97_007282 [Dioscorea zingiberensis]|uniref:Glycosyltransferase n=1 Tax=Dioscorea zingiberensis TaxID=325984 RepID=A0A9D5DBH2_9LILI|nr:hypothetical protein J5N97_007282 [Dioscorea zingiberensis]
MTKQQHFLIVTIGSQGQLNPARHLAVLLARRSTARITLAIPLHSFRRLFPSSPPNQPQPLAGAPPNQVFFSSFSDGFDADGFNPTTGDGHHFMHQLKHVGSQTLSHLIHHLSSLGHPVTGIIYTILFSWIPDLAGDLGIPYFFYWIQPASVFTIYYHHFINGIKDLTKTLIPGLPPLSHKDLPSILSDPIPGPYLPDFENLFRVLNKHKSTVLMNTFTALESEVISAIADKLEIIPIGPLVDDDSDPESTGIVSLYEHDSSEDYMEWLNSKEDGSVVYLSFGSLSVLSERQVGEILRGLGESGRPYLWVLRKNNRGGAIDEMKIEGEKGKVVGWCSQMRVLRHRSVGCFVTHCGWNSMAEGLVAGVPMVMVPQWVDQMTNARMAEKVWGVGMRVEVEEGLVRGEQVRRCLEVVMGEGSEGVEIRRRAAFWKDKALEALGQDGSSTTNLMHFIQSFSS